MSAILQLGANRINANTAGVTSVEPEPPTAVGPTWSEVQSGIGSEYGGLSHLFGEGLSAIRPAETAVTIPTDSVRGRLGGLVPKLGSIVSTGSTTTNAPATVTGDPTSTGESITSQVPAAASAAKGGAAQAVAKVRKAFGI